MQSQRDYHWRDLRFGEQFVEIYEQGEDGRYTVDTFVCHAGVRMADDTPGAMPTSLRS